MTRKRDSMITNGTCRVDIGRVLAMVWVSMIVFGCMDDDNVPMPEVQVDIEAYIGSHCTGGTEHVFAVDAAFEPFVLTILATATDYLNDELGVDVQICAVLSQEEAQHWDGYYIRYGDWDGSGTVGKYSWTTGILDLFLDGYIHSEDHLRKVYLHEMGHHFGVSTHSQDHDDIMCTGWWGVTDYSAYDLENIKAAMASWDE